MPEDVNEKYWILGVLGFLGFLGLNAWRSHDPLLLFSFCMFGLFGFFNYKYDSKLITYISLIGVALGLILGILGLLGVIKV